jgi:hypothetical protein
MSYNSLEKCQKNFFKQLNGSVLNLNDPDKSLSIAIEKIKRAQKKVEKFTLLINPKQISLLQADLSLQVLSLIIKVASVACLSFVFKNDESQTVAIGALSTSVFSIFITIGLAILYFHQHKEADVLEAKAKTCSRKNLLKLTIFIEKCFEASLKKRGVNVDPGEEINEPVEVLTKMREDHILGVSNLEILEIGGQSLHKITPLDLKYLRLCINYYKSLEEKTEILFKNTMNRFVAGSKSQISLALIDGVLNGIACTTIAVLVSNSLDAFALNTALIILALSTLASIGLGGISIYQKREKDHLKEAIEFFPSENFIQISEYIEQCLKTLQELKSQNSRTFNQF